ncbi:UNVERIFIED_CONTAM: hypothetical protein Sindi_2877100 [Sesamum indicum]
MEVEILDPKGRGKPDRQRVQRVLRKGIGLKFLNRDAAADATLGSPETSAGPREELSFLFNSLPTLETAQPEVGSSGWKSTARRVVSGAPPAALENPEDRVPSAPGRTHNRIRSPSEQPLVDGTM